MAHKGSVDYDATAAIALTNQASQAVTSAKSLVIDSPSMYEMAGEELQDIKALQKRIEAYRTSITGPLNLAVKAINDLFRSPKDFLDQAESVCKSSMLTWKQEQDRVAQEAERAAQRVAAIERQRLQEAEAKSREEARLAGIAAQNALIEADKAAAAGNIEAKNEALRIAREQEEMALDALEKADESAMTSEIVTVAPVDLPQAKATGISTRMTYTAQVENLKELVKAVHEGKAPLECLMADERFLGAQARAFKKAGALYPGVVSMAKESMAARSA